MTEERMKAIVTLAARRAIRTLFDEVAKDIPEVEDLTLGDERSLADDICLTMALEESLEIVLARVEQIKG